MKMDSSTITALSTALLVIVGIAQIGILRAQRRQSQLALIEEYRRRWRDNIGAWGIVVFIGRDEDDYYQVLGRKEIENLVSQRDYEGNKTTPTVWAKDAAIVVFGHLSDICIRILQGQLYVRDVYPLLGTELLRHSRPLRILLDKTYPTYAQFSCPQHTRIREEVQDWLLYHDGIRRRCLILIDLLWAEAARLEDLSPSDLLTAAEAKTQTGKMNRKRLRKECKRLNKSTISVPSWMLCRFLRNSEYRRFGSRIGIDKKRLIKLDQEWTDLLLKR